MIRSISIVACVLALIVTAALIAFPSWPLAVAGALVVALLVTLVALHVWDERSQRIQSSALAKLAAMDARIEDLVQLRRDVDTLRTDAGFRATGRRP